MPHKKGHGPQIQQAPSRFTSLVRNIKASPQAPYPFIRKALIGAAFLTPSPLGKGNMVKNMASFAKQAKKANNPFTNTTTQYLRGNKSPYANTTRQQIQGIVDARLKSRLAEATFKPQAELATATLKPRTFSNMMFGNLRSTMTQIKNKFTGPKAYKAKVVGKPGKTISVKDPNTKQVSFVNPRISMTAAERRRAGY